VYDVTADEVKDLFDMLGYAESYLTDRGQVGQYSVVAGDKFAFRQLKKNRPSLQTEAKKSVFDQIAYAIIDDPEAVADRAYKTIPDAAKYFDRIVEGIQATFDLKSSNPKPAGSNLLGGGPTGMVTAVLGVLKDKKNGVKVREVIREALAAEYQKEIESKKANYVFLQVKRAAQALDDAAAALNPDASKQGVSDLLTSVEESVAKINKWIYGKLTN
jgi:hypothetical protein